MIKLFFVPIGSYEQHGPHLPPETDFLIAYKLSEYVSSFFKGELIDGIKIGISTEHEGFKNTKSILSGEFITQILNILKNIEGNCKYVFINAHGGNNNVLIEIQKKKKNIIVFNTFTLIKKELNDIRTSRIGGICHAGEYETSLMLYLHPDLVKMNKLEKSDIFYVPFLDPNYKGERMKEWKTRDFSVSGILGDPFHGSAKKGELWFEALSKKIIHLIKDLITI